MKYRTKVDVGLAMGIGVFLGLGWMAAYLAIGRSYFFGWPLLAVVVGVLALVLPVSYRLTETELVVRSGLLRWRIPFDAIQEVHPTSNPLSSPAWSLDRLGRSLIGLVQFLDDLNAARVDLFLYREGADTRTPAGRMYYQMAGVFAEYERGRLRERVQSGLARAKANGTKLGRPRVSLETEAAVLAARAEGKGKCKIARELGVGVSTVQRIVG